MTLHNITMRRSLSKVGTNQLILCLRVWRNSSNLSTGGVADLDFDWLVVGFVAFPEIPGSTVLHILIKLIKTTLIETKT